MRKGPIIVVLLLALALLGLCQETQAEVTVEGGAGFLSSQASGGGTAIITERWGGPYKSRYAVGMGYIYKQHVLTRKRNYYNLDENLFVFAQRRISFYLKGCEWDCISVGLGVAYFNSTNRALGSNFNAALSIEFRPTDKWSLNIRHFSNAGSATPNMGQDMITIGYTF
jgi:hypothetical protein